MSTSTTPRRRQHSKQQHKVSPGLLAVGFVALVLALYGIVRVGGRGEVLGPVSVLDVELGGMTEDEATEAIGDLELRLAGLPAPVSVEGATVDIVPLETGFGLDTDAILEAAMAVGRSPNPLSNFFWWITHLGRNTEVEPSGQVDPEALDDVLTTLDKSLVGSPPFEGSLAVVDGELVAEYPTAGRQIDRDQAEVVLVEAFLDPTRPTATLEVTDRQPTLAPADIDAARSEAEFMLSAPVTLTAAESETALTFSTEDLTAAFVATLAEDPVRLELGFDPDVIDAQLAEVRQDYEAAPVNARFEISGYDVSILEGRNGTLLDAEETAAILTEASHTSIRRDELPLREGAEPEVTTASLEALDIRHLVAEFTTYFDCCQARVTNIRLIAEEVDGVIVRPGASFSLNDHVGRRTAEDGYVDAGTILGGEIVDTVGGGVSQFATTFYNAVFWGGYQDVDHKPHSFYFERYPEGIEATISWPSPDLAFSNNDDAAILIKTSVSDTSVTVRFYGNNDGRILSGSQSGGRLSVGVIREGGPTAKQVRGDRSERFNFTEPPATLFRPNPDLAVDQQVTVQRPGEGWSITVTRTITIGDQTTTEEWPVRYVAKQEIIEVHPCKMPGQEAPCPTTTTTTIPPETTVTTVPPPTTVPTTTATPSETTTTTAP